MRILAVIRIKLLAVWKSQAAADHDAGAKTLAGMKGDVRSH